MDELLALSVIAAILLGILGLLLVLYSILTSKNVFKKQVSEIRKKTDAASLLVVLGSGGHTTEILSMVNHLGSHYRPRYYVMAKTDKMSEDKVTQLEAEKSEKKDEYKVYKIPRSREVKQSWITTVISTIYAAVYAFPLVFILHPEIVLCNGPGTCIPICFAAFLLKTLLGHTVRLAGVIRMTDDSLYEPFRAIKVIYVESICRVESLSLSGKILYHLADELLVQWPELQTKYPKTKYLGRVV